MVCMVCEQKHTYWNRSGKYTGKISWIYCENVGEHTIQRQCHAAHIYNTNTKHISKPKNKVTLESMKHTKQHTKHPPGTTKLHTNIEQSFFLTIVYTKCSWWWKIQLFVQLLYLFGSAPSYSVHSGWIRIRNS